MSQSYEADLYPVNAPKRTPAKGELEYVLFQQGHSTLEVEVKRSVGLPPGDVIEVYINGAKACEVTVTEMKTDVTFRSKEGDAVPEVNLGDTAAIVHNGEVILQGVFKHDD